jgi:hypothetical protein
VGGGLSATSAERRTVEDVPILRQARSMVGNRSTGVSVAAIAITAGLLRLPLLTRQEYPDEGGLLLVARHWTLDGPGLYGRLFVDRPPVLLAFFRLADLAGGFVALRLLGVLLTVLTVLLLGLAGHLLAGRRGALWSSVVAATLLLDPMLGSVEVNAELVGLPLVAAAVTLGLLAMSPGRHACWLLVAAGLAAGTAPLVKQNLLGAGAFVVVLVLADGWSQRRAPLDVGVRLSAVVVGAVVPVLVALLLAAAGPGVGAFWEAVVTFRVSASEVIGGRDSPANEHRVWLLVTISVTSGLALLAAAAGWLLRRTPREPAVLAAGAMLATDLIGVVGGGSYWNHYLLTLVPAVSLLVALASRTRSRLLPAATAVAVTASLVMGVFTMVRRVEQPLGREGQLAAWLDRARRDGDSGTVIYGQPQVLDMSGLNPGYAYLWSLPVRVKDPDLVRLTARLSAPSGPEWVIALGSLDTWSLDPNGGAQAALDEHYRPVATVCEYPVYLRHGLTRTLPALPTCPPSD